MPSERLKLAPLKLSHQPLPGCFHALSTLIGEPVLPRQIVGARLFGQGKVHTDPQPHPAERQLTAKKLLDNSIMLGTIDIFLLTVLLVVGWGISLPF